MSNYDGLEVAITLDVDAKAHAVQGVEGYVIVSWNAEFQPKISIFVDRADETMLPEWVAKLVRDQLEEGL